MALVAQGHGHDRGAARSERDGSSVAGTGESGGPESSSAGVVIACGGGCCGGFGSSTLDYQYIYREI